jgi:hypothetical protein
MSENVLADAQFGIAKVLRPYAGFDGTPVTSVVGSFVMPKALGLPQISANFTVPAVSSPVTVTVTNTVTYGDPGTSQLWLGSTAGLYSFSAISTPGAPGSVDIVNEGVGGTASPGDTISAPVTVQPVAYIEVGNSSAFTVGQTIRIGNSAGFFTVEAIPDGTHLIVKNTGNAANAVTGLVIPPGASIVANFGSYDGLAGITPIMFTEGGIALDDLAGTPGYSANLVRGLSVPLGSRVVVWLPQFQLPSAEQYAEYAWLFMWRMRNTYDFRTSRRSYHYPKQGQGVPDTTAPVGKQARVVIPGAYPTIIFNQSPATGGFFPVEQQVVTELFSPRPAPTSPPITPTGSIGEMQQGVADPAAFGVAAFVPTWQCVETQALGDELLVALYKGAGFWDLANGGADHILSVAFGNGSGQEYPDLGVYVLPGSAP